MMKARLLLVVAPLCLGCFKNTDSGSFDQSEANTNADAAACHDVQVAYKALTENASRVRCSTTDDCHVLSGQCGAALGACYHAVNRTVDQEKLNALGEQYRMLGCIGMGPVCRCGPMPKVECRSKACALIH